jgi:hypothetical protein
MTKLAILALGLALAYTPVHAQESKPQVLTLEHDCAKVENVVPYLRDEYGENPFALGTAVVTLPGDKDVNGVLLLTVNPKTKTYTINIVFEEDGMICMLTSGEDFQPADSRPKISL